MLHHLCAVSYRISLVHKHGPAAVIFDAAKLLLYTCLQYRNLLRITLRVQCEAAVVHTLRTWAEKLPMFVNFTSASVYATLHQMAACFVVGQQDSKMSAHCCALQADWGCSSTDTSFLLLGSIARWMFCLCYACMVAVTADHVLPVCGVAGKKGLTHMRLDGEPWAQPFPAKGAAEGPLRVPSLHALACLFVFACVSIFCLGPHPQSQDSSCSSSTRKTC